MPTTSESSQRVFISYSRKDSGFVQNLAKALSERGYLIDYDRAPDPDGNLGIGIAAEDEWWKRLEQMIASCDAIVFLVSSHSAASRICDKEVAFASALGKRMIPAIIEPIDFKKAPPRLAALNVKINFTNGGIFATVIDDLCAALEINVMWRRQGRQIAQQANEWKSHGREKSYLQRGELIRNAESWMTKRPVSEPPIGEVVMEFIAESRRSQDEERDAYRRLVQRSFVAPVYQLTNGGISDNRLSPKGLESDAAVRRLAAAGLLT